SPTSAAPTPARASCVTPGDLVAVFVRPSCPGLSRAPTSFFHAVTKDVDGRDEPGHDVEAAFHLPFRRRLWDRSPTTRNGDNAGWRAAIFRTGQIVVDTLPEPTPGAGQVLVKSLACGICGSDLHARQHAHRTADLAKFTGRQPMDLSRDIVFGH